MKRGKAFPGEGKSQIRRISFWVGLIPLILLLVLGGVSSGIAGVLILLGIFLFFTMLYSLLIGRRSWLGIPNRKTAAIGLAASLAITFGSAAIADTDTNEKPSSLVSVPGSVAPTAKASGEQSLSANQASNAPEISVTDGAAIIAAEKKLAEEKQAEAERTKAEEAKKAAVAEKAEKAKKAAAAEKAKKAAAAEKAKKAAEKAKKAKSAAAAQQALREKESSKKVAAKQNAPRSSGFVHPGSFCSGGTGVSKRGKPMVCGVGSDGRMRWKSR